MIEFVSVRRAAVLYCTCQKTIRRRIASGALVAMKNGGKWLVETPQSAYNRINNINKTNTFKQ